MIKIIILVYIISVYISLPGLFNKAGYSSIKGLIPFYNIYILVQILEINPILLIIVSLGLIFLPFRMWIATLIFLLLPFLINDAYNKGFISSVLTLILPFLMYPFIAYMNGEYIYYLED